MSKKIPLWGQILIGTAIGVFIGLMFPNLGASLKPLGDAFIRGIRMIILPLIFSALVIAVAKVGDVRKVGVMATRAMFLFFVVTGIAIILGITLNSIFHPAAGVSLKATGAIPANLATSISWVNFFLELIPVNVVASAAEGKLLPVIFFALCFGFSLALIGEKANPTIHLLESILEAMFKLTAGVVAFAPIGIAGIMAWVMATQGTSVLIGLAKLVLTMYLGLLILLILFWVFLKFIVGVGFMQTFKKVLEPLILAFTTCSSEVTLPLHMKILQASGIPSRIVSFVLPLGYSFNLDGAALYQGLVVSFLLEAYGLNMTMGDKGVVFLTLLIATKGSAAVPSGSLVVIATVLVAMGIPIEGIAIVAGVDRFMDMGRTAVNVLGNTVAALMIAKWEGVLGKPDDVEVEATTNP